MAFDEFGSSGSAQPRQRPVSNSVSKFYKLTVSPIAEGAKSLKSKGWSRLCKVTQAQRFLQEEPKMRKLALTAAALLLTPLLWASPAQATLISIGLEENGGPISTVATDGGTGTVAFSGAFGTYTADNISVSGAPAIAQPQLLTNSLNIGAGAGSNVLTVYVTEQGLSTPTGVSSFLSSFTSNLLNGIGTTVEEQTLINTSNGLYTGTQLASANFANIGTSTSLNNTPSLAAPYSETAVYTITTTGPGNVNDTINITANMQSVPEPASLGLLGMGLLGMALMRRRSSLFRGETGLGTALPG